MKSFSFDGTLVDELLYMVAHSAGRVPFELGALVKVMSSIAIGEEMIVTRTELGEHVGQTGQAKLKIFFTYTRFMASMLQKVHDAFMEDRLELDDDEENALHGLYSLFENITDEESDQFGMDVLFNYRAIPASDAEALETLRELFAARLSQGIHFVQVEEIPKTVLKALNLTIPK